MVYLTYHWPHTSCFRLITPSSGDLAPDLIVQLEDVVDGGLVVDHATGHIVQRWIQVVGTIGAQTLQKIIFSSM